MFHNIISIDDPEKEFYKILLPETSSKERFSLQIRHENSKTIIDIETKDYSSLKAINHSAMELLELITKTKSFIKKKTQ